MNIYILSGLLSWLYESGRTLRKALVKSPLRPAGSTFSGPKGLGALFVSKIKTRTGAFSASQKNRGGICLPRRQRDLSSSSQRKSARLFYDAGLDTLEQIAEWDPEKTRETLIQLDDRTGFEGAASTSIKSGFHCTTRQILA